MTVAAKKQKFSYVPADKKPAGPVMGGLGLEEMGDLSALLAGPEAVVQGGGPLALEMALIDEDPHQPRTKDNPGFSDHSLEELAASIQLRGVKTPISVRENPDASFLIDNARHRDAHGIDHEPRIRRPILLRELHDARTHALAGSCTIQGCGVTAHVQDLDGPAAHVPDDDARFHIGATHIKSQNRVAVLCGR